MASKPSLALKLRKEVREPVAALLERSGAWTAITTHQDLTGRDRATSAVLRDTAPGTSRPRCAAAATPWAAATRSSAACWPAWTAATT